MTDELTDAEARALGERWIAAGGGWPDGTLARWDDGAISERLDGGLPGDADRPRSEWWPDFRDDATKGAALGVVRARWGEPVLGLSEGLNGGWEVWRWSGPSRVVRGGGSSEAECLVAALEAAPREVSDG